MNAPWVPASPEDTRTPPQRLADALREHRDGRTEAIVELTDEVRTLIEALVTTDATESALSDAAEAVRAVSRTLADAPSRVADSAEGHFSGFISASPVFGLANALAPPMVITEADDDVVTARVTFGQSYEGPPGHVHGGYIAAAFDEILGMAQTLSGQSGMTGGLDVRYRSPTPLHQELTVVGRFERIEGRKIFTSGAIHIGDRLCAEATGVFIAIDFQAMAEKLAAGED